VLNELLTFHAALTNTLCHHSHQPHSARWNVALSEEEMPQDR
jgi:hypothetical protein